MEKRCLVVPFILVLLCCARFRESIAATTPTTVEKCSGSTLNASCDSTSAVLMIRKAVYGRMKSGGLCDITSQLYVGCSSDVTSYVERRCAGRRQCQMKVDDDVRNLAAQQDQACPRDLVGYLEVTYYCLQVYDNASTTCTTGHPLAISSPNFYLANVVTHESGRGSSNCAWLIRVSYGQTVNVTLIDFAFDETSSPSTMCPVYARMWIGAAKEPFTVCSRDARERVLHTYTGKEDIRIDVSNSSTQRDLYFLLHVVVRQTFSCPEYQPKWNEQIMSVDNETILLQCAEDSRRSWTLNCVDGHWTRPQNNVAPIDCSRLTTMLPSDDQHVQNSSTFGTEGIVIVLVVALIITLLIITVGVIVYLYSKWRKRGHQMNGNQRLDPSDYGTSTFGLHPGVLGNMDCCDAVSVGEFLRSRSQRDLCYTPGTPSSRGPASRFPPGNYASTFDMRRNASTGGAYGFAGCPSRIVHAGGSQMTLPDIWSTNCPLHGTGTYGRHRQINHVYDMPLVDMSDHGGGEVQQSAQVDGHPTSPYYHQLEGLAFGVDSGPTPPPRPVLAGPPTFGMDDAESSSNAAFSKM